MEEMNFGDIASIDWVALAGKAQTVGVDLGLKVIVAILIFYVGRMLARAISNGLKRLMQKQEIDKILETFVSSMAYWVLMTVVIIAAINQLGIQTTSLIAVLGAAGLAVGLALQGSLSNFAAGVLIVLFRPYRVGDFVEAAGVSGSVEQVQILTTILKTPDNKRIIVPNSAIMSSIITNYSANETRRVDLVFGVGYDDDLDKVHAILREIVEADERILEEPEYVIKVNELADSSVNFICRPWVKSGDYWAVYWDLTETVKKRFDQEGISIPFPQRDVHLHQVTT
jgi:small conductance mechanosensitive channel